MKGYLTVGKVVSSWGIKGHIKVEPSTDDIRRFKDLKEIYIKTTNGQVAYKVESVIFPQKTSVAMKLDSIQSKNEAEKLRGYYINVHRDDAVRLPKDSYFICDIIGLQVYTEDEVFIGEITDVLQTGANDVYIIQNEAKKEVLIPAIKEVIIDIDLNKGTMLIRPLEGLL